MMLGFQARILTNKCPVYLAPWVLMLKGLKVFKWVLTTKVGLELVEKWMEVGKIDPNSDDHFDKFKKWKEKWWQLKMGYRIGRYFVAVIIFKKERNL